MKRRIAIVSITVTLLTATAPAALASVITGGGDDIVCVAHRRLKVGACVDDRPVDAVEDLIDDVAP